MNFTSTRPKRNCRAKRPVRGSQFDSVHEVHRTSDAATDAAYALASIAPTTIAGVVGLLQYAVSIHPEEWPEGVHSDDDTETRPWHYFLVDMLIDVLPGMAVRS